MPLLIKHDQKCKRKREKKLYWQIHLHISMLYCWIINYEGIMCKKEARRTQERFGVYSIKYMKILHYQPISNTMLSTYQILIGKMEIHIIAMILGILNETLWWPYQKMSNLNIDQNLYTKNCNNFDIHQWNVITVVALFKFDMVNIHMKNVQSCR